MYLFKELPSKDLTDIEEMRQFLPYSDKLPTYTKMLNRKEIKRTLSEAK